MMRSKSLLKIIVLVAVPLFILIVFALSGLIIDALGNVPTCPFYLQFGAYCPAYGNTRSTIALLNGNIIDSLRYNITIIFLCLLAAAFYVEAVVSLFNKKVCIVPRSNVFIFIMVAGFLAYFVVRNFV